jgi:dTDP-4-amino-4,6-dideoxygalactose transaminase
MAELAILGGAPSITRRIEELWKRPVERQKALAGEMIERGELTGAGAGVGKQFEERFAAYVGCRYALSFSHGTAALAAAYYAAGVGPGDEVITPALGYIASYAGALHMGARPVFCDVAAESMLIDPARIARAISARTRAVNIIHMNGRVCDLGQIMQICREHGLALVDDASHAAGAEWDGRKLGGFEHVTCFSLQGVDPTGKPISTGEGGMACTNDQASYERMLVYCHLHRQNLTAELAKTPFAFLDKQVLGLKWRPHPLAMALGLVSLESIEERTAKQRAHHAKLVERMARFPFVRALASQEGSTIGGFYDGIKVAYESRELQGIPISVFLRALATEGVPVTPQGTGHFEYRRRLYAERFDLWGRARGPIGAPWQGLDAFVPPDPADFPVAEASRERVFTLPSFIAVDETLYAGLEEALEKISQARDRLRPR